MVDEFDVKEDLAANSVIGMPDLSKVDERVDCCEEGTVQPSSTLRDELRNRI